MGKPVISVVIPTRDRPDTLEACLRGMRRHQSRRIEIIVQDNCSGPDTKAVVEAAQKRDGRIRYTRAPHPASQRQNFELGLAEAQGEYMSIIGDDDGYCIGSLDWLVDKLRAKRVDAVRWSLLQYIWPSLSTDGEGFANLIPAMCYGGAKYTACAPLAAKAFCAETAGSWENVLVYHGMISRRIYDKMRAMSGNNFFAYPLPDVYAHNIIPMFCDRILQVNDFVSIYGLSRHSAGASWARTTPRKQGADECDRWIAETSVDEVANKIAWQPDIRTQRYHDFSVFKLAERCGMLGGRKVDHEIWIKAMITEVRQNPWQLPAWRSVSEMAPFDEEVFYKVRAAFNTHLNVGTDEPGLKIAPVTGVSLRVRSVDAQLRDDVEGVALAVAQVTKNLLGDVDHYRARTANRRLTLRIWARRVALCVYQLAPTLSSYIMRSGYVPTRLHRYLKASGEDYGPTARLAKRISELHRSLDVRRSLKAGARSADSSSGT